MSGNPNASNFRVAIVGGGMGGSTAAYYLRQLFGSRVAITLFEQSGRIGGRMKSIDFAGQREEMGASIFHESNQYMLKFAKQFGLDIKDESKSDDRIMFYAGHEHLSFSTLGGASFLVPFRLLWRYGIPLMQVRWYTGSIIRDFVKIYSLQDRGYCFTTTARLFEALKPEFLEMTKWTYGDWLSKKHRVGETLKEEIAYGLVSNNYCQNLNVHAFVGFITMATLLSKLFSVKGGNEQVPQRLVDSAMKGGCPDNPSQLVNAQVTSIRSTKVESCSWEVEYRPNDGKQIKRDTFDYVILAVPLNQQTNIQTDGSVQLPYSEYQQVDKCLFYGSLKNWKFGIGPSSYLARQGVVICPNQTSYLTGTCAFRSLISFSMEKNRTNEQRIWNSFSVPRQTPDPIKSIGNEYIDQSGEKPTPPAIVNWLAYPVYEPVQNPHEDLGKFVLAPKFYYVNAIEKMASCIEIAAIGGRNAALLVAADMEASETRNGNKNRKPLAMLDQKVR
ncbi:prenylcysteine oxidase [Clonorchis sinensis]|uniref:Prenylcysteine oxidase n=1 Tax=Clonorchis sinensis TaxID=79923 RepID=H2KUL0_CLOSI|nr:prenylcysteine oxidase [Clonorchis sinensis]